MAILFPLAGLAARPLTTVYLIKYLPPGHLSELCTEKKISPSRFRHLLCVLYLFVPHVIDFLCTESTSASQECILTCNHIWGIRTQILSGLCMENFCCLPINSHLLLIGTFESTSASQDGILTCNHSRGIQTQILSYWLYFFFDDASWFKYALCTSQLVFAWLFYEIRSPGRISCPEFISCLR